MLIACTLFILALSRGWLVPGWYHRYLIDKADARSEKDAETIKILSDAVTEKTSTESATAHILDQLRQAITSSEAK